MQQYKTRNKSISKLLFIHLLINYRSTDPRMLQGMGLDPGNA